MRLSGFRVAVVLMASMIMTVATLPAALAAEPESAAPDFVVVHIEVADPAEVALLDQFIDIWSYDPNKGIVDAAVTADGEQVLLDFGYSL